MSVNIFEYNDYREVIERHIFENRKERAYRTRLAEAAKCHLSYFTRALKGECELTPDHAYGLCHFWQLDEGATQYFLTTVYLARASAPALRRLYQVQLERIRDENRDLSKQAGFANARSPSFDAQYYGSWIPTAVHLLTSVPAYQTPAALAGKLRLDEGVVATVLEKLVESGLVLRKKDKFVCARGGLHVPRGSALAWMHLFNWRHQALANAHRPTADLHFTSVYSLSAEDAKTLKGLLVQYIAQCEAKLADSPDETVVAVNLDFFEV